MCIFKFANTPPVVSIETYSFSCFLISLQVISSLLMPLALLFHYLLLNMFRMLIHPSSGACDLFDELFHGLYCSGSMCVGVTVWFGWDGVVYVCWLKQ